MTDNPFHIEEDAAPEPVPFMVPKVTTSNESLDAVRLRLRGLGSGVRKINAVCASDLSAADKAILIAEFSHES